MIALRGVATAVAHTGLPALAWRYRRARAHEGRAMVLCYHRVSDETDYLGLCTPVTAFERQMATLRQRASVVPLRDLVERLADPTPLANDLAAVTFDDGYRDNLDTALPILRRHGLPATLFVATGFVDGEVRPAGERLLEAFDELWRRDASPGLWDGLHDDVDPFVLGALARPGSAGALRKLRARLKRLPHSLAASVLDELERLAGIRAHPSSATLDWDGVRTLAKGGVEIGSHTMSHAILSRLSADAAAAEMRDSKKRIEAEIDLPVSGFAFPNGAAGDFENEHVAQLPRCGYRYACTTERGASRPGADVFRLRRIGVGADPEALLDLKLVLAKASQPCVA